jgi:hypothetical protein
MMMMMMMMMMTRKDYGANDGREKDNDKLDEYNYKVEVEGVMMRKRRERWT